MEDSVVSKVERILVRIDWLEDQNGRPEPEIVMDVAEYFDTDDSIIDDISDLKKEYTETVKTSRSLKYAGEKKRKEAWSMCRVLSDFTDKNKFNIVNIAEALARDLEISARNVKDFLDFGRWFENTDVMDKVSLGHYRELSERAERLDKLGLLGVEKTWLLDSAMSGSLRDSKKYRERLNMVIRDGGTA